MFRSWSTHTDCWQQCILSPNVETTATLLGRIIPVVDTKGHGRDQVLIDLARNHFPIKKISKTKITKKSTCRVLLLQDCRRKTGWEWEYRECRATVQGWARLEAIASDTGPIREQWGNCCGVSITVCTLEQAGFSPRQSQRKCQINAPALQTAAVSGGKDGRSCAIAHTCSFVVWGCSTSGSCWALTALSGQQEQRCLRQKQQQRAAGGTAMATPRPQEIQSSCCQHQCPSEKVKYFVFWAFWFLFFVFFWLPVQLVGLCSWSAPAGKGYGRVLMQREKNTPGYVGKVPGNKATLCW